MAVPKKDSVLAAWSTNTNTRLVADGALYDFTPTEVAAYTTVHEAFIAAYEAISPGSRSKSLVTAKDTAKAELLGLAREYYGLIAANTSISDADKDLIGVAVRRAPAPRPAPDFAPVVDVESVDGTVVSVRMHGPDALRRGLPPLVDGIALFSYVGEEAPTDPSLFKFEANLTRSTVKVVFPNTLTPGTTVWITAMYFNERKQAGPGASPVSAVINYPSTIAA